MSSRDRTSSSNPRATLSQGKTPANNQESTSSNIPASMPSKTLFSSLNLLAQSKTSANNRELHTQTQASNQETPSRTPISNPLPQTLARMLLTLLRYGCLRNKKCSTNCCHSDKSSSNRDSTKSKSTSHANSMCMGTHATKSSNGTIAPISIRMR